MKVSLFILAILGSIGAIRTPALAQNYPWCANYAAGRDGGGTNCGFTSFEQCQATLSGIGGFCDRNTQYVPAQGPRALHRPRKHTVNQP